MTSSDALLDRQQAAAVAEVVIEPDFRRRRRLDQQTVAMHPLARRRLWRQVQDVLGSQHRLAVVVRRAVEDVVDHWLSPAEGADPSHTLPTRLK